MSTTDLAPGANLAALRKAHGLSQGRLARKASVSVSLLSKIEVGDRALTPAVAAAVGKALGITMAEVLGRATVARDDEQRLSALRSAIRDYDLPLRQGVEEQRISAALESAGQYRDNVEVTRLLAMLPQLLREATTYAHATNTVESWMALADVYSTVYWLAARHRWMDMAELAVSRQRWATEQKTNPLGEALAARDRAGAYLNFGDVETGLMVVDRAVTAAQSTLSGTERDIAVGILNLRGMTLAGRLDDKREAAREAERHIRSARNASASFASDIDVHGLTFGPRNTFTHELATRVDLGRPQEALNLTDNVDAALAGLPATRIAPTRINLARAQLDVGDRDGALENLSVAWGVAPQLARIHPMGREVFRVLTSLHRRSNAKLLRLSKVSGIQL
ncbi:helix-turn-helix domain-containing protein [Streptomyces sp. NBC_00091]|uniref:helix-turn-helix domain-containing protein n=1 Tax=Streptomyces sp. NBC_00091 TaxID=2975648 RepID=UPI0022549D59|nr:helix-turn-helix transcriptional regulator [Streptomyces sp. NBC_00091]MCX5376165.1 helix-turn-helix transcriptional regulator [Streptomyces sp. NBC_00091]